MLARCLPALLILLMPWDAAVAASFDAKAINEARYEGGELPEGQSALTVRLQILLDRAHASPGVIDGYFGENVEKAVRALRSMKGLSGDGSPDRDVWAAIENDTDVMVSYTITEEDMRDLVEEIPEDFAKLAEMDWLGYTSVEERLAERFHMNVELLRSLNPQADFAAAGTAIMVADTGEDQDRRVKRIEADRKQRQLRAYGEDGEMVAAYPVTIGSRQTPSPSGTHEVTAIAIEPTYSYRPDENFQQGDNDEPLTLPPGPNNPVGLVWIDLSEPTYGIHGTPAPEQIDKQQSHGCVRMTNWDARELAELVEKGITVEFLE